METIRIGIAGFGNIGKGVVAAIPKYPDMKLSVIVTRRNPSQVPGVSGVPLINESDVESWRDKVDVLILCGGSATDLPNQGPLYAKLFNTVDSFDTHACIPEYFGKMNDAAQSGNNLLLISCGWDPGLFSLMRVLTRSILPTGSDYTFWGTGVSQGHSDAIRRVPGVKNAVQYTIPRAEALERVRAGENPELSTRDKHLRECFVVLKDGFDKKEVERIIIQMPNYFADYDTTVHFVDEAELAKHHSRMPHGGFVIRSGKTTEENSSVIEFSLKLDSNPEFTASILVAYARAVYWMHKSGKSGAISVLDVPLALLSLQDGARLRKELL